MKIDDSLTDGMFSGLLSIFVCLSVVFLLVYSNAHFNDDSYYNQYNKGFSCGYNGTIEEYNYSVSYTEYRNYDNSRNAFKDGEQGYNEGFIDGYRKRQLDIEKEKLQKR